MSIAALSAPPTKIEVDVSTYTSKWTSTFVDDNYTTPQNVRSIVDNQGNVYLMAESSTPQIAALNASDGSQKRAIFTPGLADQLALSPSWRIERSALGKYVVLPLSGTTGVEVYKDGSLLQTLLSTVKIMAAGISGNGKFIAVLRRPDGAAITVELFEGS